MQMGKTLGLVLAAGALACGRTPASMQMSLPESRRRAITAAVEAVADSVFAAGTRRDVAMYSFYSPDATMLLDGAAVAWTDHQAAAPAFFASLRSAHFRPLAYEVDVLTPTQALWRGRYEYAFTDTSGARISGTGAQTWVLTQRPSGWRIVHAHVSYPPPPPR